MKIIGITGGIGSGKSTLSRLLEVYGIPVYIADLEAKKLMNQSPEIREALIREFGEEVYSEKELNRSKLAALIFNSPKAIAFVNSVVHPAVQVDFQHWIKTRSEAVVAIESAILFESGFDSLVNITVNVSAPLSSRIERVMKRDGASREEVVRRINNQLSEEERNSRSDFVLINDNITPLIPQTERLLS